MNIIKNFLNSLEIKLSKKYVSESTFPENNIVQMSESYLALPLYDELSERRIKKLLDDCRRSRLEFEYDLWEP